MNSAKSTDRISNLGKMKNNMPDTSWIEAIKRWRSLPSEEKLRRRLEAIPRHVANSMAMAGEPVDEEWIRGRLLECIQQNTVQKTSEEKTLTKSPKT